MTIFLKKIIYSWIKLSHSPFSKAGKHIFQKCLEQPMCFSYFRYYYDKVCDQSNLEEKGFILADSSKRDAVHHGRNEVVQGAQAQWFMLHQQSGKQENKKQGWAVKPQGKPQWHTSSSEPASFCSFWTFSTTISQVFHNTMFVTHWSCQSGAA